MILSLFQRRLWNVVVRKVPELLLSHPLQNTLGDSFRVHTVRHNPGNFFLEFVGFL